MEEMVTLILDGTYEINVTEKDYERSLRDPEFSKYLLCEAKRLANPEGNESFSNRERRLSENRGSCSEEVAGAPDFGPQEDLSSANVWSFQKTMSLIHSMATVYKDFNDPRKRKHIFEHVSNDMVSSGFAVDWKHVQNKWKSLMRSYNKAKDNKKRTGQGPSRFLFFEAIDDIVGTQPKHNCHHSINSLEISSASTVLENPESFLENNNNLILGTGSTTVDTVVDPVPNITILPESTVHVEEMPSAEDPEIIRMQHKRKRASEKQLRQDYLDIKAQEYERRQRRHEERCEIERERNAIERRKVQILEEYVRHKMSKANSQ